MNPIVRDGVVRHRDAILRYAFKLTRDRARAEDLVQDVTLRAIVKEDKYVPRDGVSVLSWLLTLTHHANVNRVRNGARKSARALCLGSDVLDRIAHVLPGKDNPEAAMVARETLACAARLPKEQRRAIELVGLEGLRYEDAAEEMGVPVGTVRSRLSRGREALRLMSEGRAA